MIEESQRGLFIKSHYWSYLAQVGIIAVIYFGIAKLSLALTGHPSPVWPPAGFALAVILLFGYRLWPGLALGTFFEVVLEGLPVPIAFATAAGSAGGALAGAYLLNRIGFCNSLERLRDVLGLVVLASLISTTISAIFGTLSFYLSGIIPWAASGSFWMTWWLGDVLGVIVVTPIVLVWSIRPHFDRKPMRIAEALALLLTLVLVSDAVFSEPAEIIRSPYFIFPFLIWAALRFGQKGATTAIIIVSGMAIWHTAHGFGPFIKGTPAENLEFLQVFTGVVALTILILAAVITERKLSQDAMAQSEEKYRMLYDSSSDAIMLLDEKSFLDCNNATLQMFGFPKKEDFTKVHPSQVSPPYQPDGMDSQTAANNRIAEAFRKGTKKFEWLHRKKNGEDFYAEVLLTAFNFKEKKVLQATIRDITERKRAEELLLENKAQLDLALQSALMGVWQWDIIKNRRYFDDHCCHLLGINPATFTGTAEEFFGAVHPDDREKIKAALVQTIEQNVLYEPEYRVVWADGSVHYITARGRLVRNDKGQPARINGLLWDITERKKVEESLKESEERYRRLVQYSPYGIAIHSQGKLVYMNLAGAKILGTENPDEIVGKMLLQIIHPDYHEIAKERVRMQEEGKVAPPLEEKFLRHDGTSVDVEVAAIPFTYMGKQAMYGVFLDITQRKKAEETRLENLRLEAADKAKSEFLATMSHELRTPLNSSIGFSDLLKQGRAGELSERQSHYVDNILTSNQFLLTLINDILDLSKIEAGKFEINMEKLPVPATIEETLSLIKVRAMEHNIIFNKDFDPGLEFIKADKQRFKQILFNLLSNAVKFTKPEGGTITIRAKKDGDMASFSVIDTGIGIKEENIVKLFRKFEQLDRKVSQKYGGTGLGLAITKQLVELHGGRIWAQSRYGEGSTFTFTLPMNTKKEEK